MISCLAGEDLDLRGVRRDIEKGGWIQTYRASGHGSRPLDVLALRLAAVLRAELADAVGHLVAAGRAAEVALEFDVEAQRDHVGGVVLFGGQEGDEGRSFLVLAGADDDRGPVAGRNALGSLVATPLACVLDRNTLLVDVVLGRGGRALVLVVAAAVGDGQGAAIAGLDTDRNGFGLGTFEELAYLEHHLARYIPG